ncbi:VWA domain-containing protein [Bacillus aquiflavi]|uniref:VWA domain-containing protein n=1 Tax=Bacillus aquiflavi TaxID=2672567 RepID=A0A6B3VXV6_9BACI|nr:BatA and WFA domain-containing protein [Bacillus aquiflavi]MBA4536195.1 VWA domain-containing protein [Bacillus aquiflavi]NEY80563.1 VWA domain-containing protein [Bacillus aquiflavi]
MGFMNPLFFLLIFFIAAFILFYFFRKQYKAIVIPSNMLWQQLMKEWQASPFLQKLQNKLLFWLQLIVFILLMFALSRPFWQVDGLKGDHLIFIVDSSASMSAKDGEASRFEVAKKKMLQIIEQVQNQEITIIVASSKPKIIVKQEENMTAVRKKIKELTLTYQHENFEKALQLAEALSEKKDTAIHIFSDGVTKEQLTTLRQEQYAEVHNIGEKVNNVSLLSFGVAPVNETISGVAVIENQADEEISFTLEVKSEGKKLFETAVKANPNEQHVVQIPTLPKAKYYQAILHVADGYKIDNKQTAIFTNTAPVVYALNDVNPFIIKGLETIGAEVIQLNEQSLHEVNKKRNGMIVTTDTTNIQHTKQPLLIVRSKEENNTPLTEQIVVEKDHLLEYVNLDQVFIQSASTRVIEGLDVVAKSGDTPLIQKGLINGQPVIDLNFAIENTDWPLQPGFPIFLYNSYQWLSQQTSFLGYFLPGEEKWFNVEDGFVWEIFNEAGENLFSFQMNKEAFIAPSKPGVYQVIAGDHVNYFSVLLDDREKDIDVAQSFIFNEARKMDKEMEKRSYHFVWFWLAAIALFILFLEWEVYRHGSRT